MRAADQIVLVKDSRSQAAEETGLSIFIDLAARTEQRRARSHQLAERDEIVLITAGSVQQEQRGRSSRFEAELHPGFRAARFGAISFRPVLW